MIASFALRESDFSAPMSCFATCWVMVDAPCAKSPDATFAHTARPMPLNEMPPWVQ